jgi:hypothetical protein
MKCFLNNGSLRYSSVIYKLTILRGLPSNVTVPAEHDSEDLQDPEMFPLIPTLKYVTSSDPTVKTRTRQRVS